MGLVQTSLLIDFNVGASTMCKYVDVVINALISRDKLFSQYIFIPHGACLLRIMDRLFHTCGNIDGSHIHFPKS
jgi:predicted small secreted protein